MNKYKKIGEDVFEVLEVNGREVIVNKTLPLRRQIEAYNSLAVRACETYDEYIAYLKKKWAAKDAAEGNEVVVIDGQPTLVKARR